MKTIAHIERINADMAESSEPKGFELDTTFVLFFLAMEFGRICSTASLDLVLMAVAMVGTAVLPYAVPGEEKPDLGVWIAGRAWIAAFGVLIGLLFDQTLGVVLPEMLRFAPMALLIVSAVLSVQVQFYRFLRYRPAR